MIAPCIAAERDLLGHWKLQGDVRDSSSHGNHGVIRNADLRPDGAHFNGRTSEIEVPAASSLRLGTRDFTWSVWVHTTETLDDVLGDILSQYDPIQRRGLTWCLKNGAGATTSQANDRNVQFGIDAGSEPRWQDCGRPGKAVYVMALAVHEGNLFAGTCEPGKDERGHVYRTVGDGRWIDCGTPDRCNAVVSLAAYQGKLYAGTGKYRLAGSSLPESPNTHLGGGVYCYEGDGQWRECGRLAGVEAVGGMAVFRGKLYATSLYRPAGFFRYEGGTRWTSCGLPEGNVRVNTLGVFNGHLYATSYDGCAVYRYDGERWEDYGRLEATGQTYAFEVHGGRLHVATWPNGHVYRLDGEKQWTDMGRLGEEKEVMGMAVHNGKLYAGTLPLAEVYRLERPGQWTRTGQLDRTPEVRYRRAWTMALYQGRLYCGTLPSGHVQALEAGRVVSHDRTLAPGWRHLAVTRQGGALHLFVDGQKVASSTSFDPAAFDLSTDQPLRIGAGPHDHFNGRLRDLRLYGRAFEEKEVTAMMKQDGK